MSDKLITMLWGSVRYAVLVALAACMITFLGLPVAASALDGLPIQTPAPPAGALIPAPPIKPPVALPPIPALPPVAVPQPPEVSVPDSSTPPSAAVAAPPAPPVGEGTSAPGGLKIGSASQGVSDTPPPPGRQSARTAADSSSASSCQGAECTPSLCPALVPAALSSGCTSASRLPALIGLAVTGQPVLTLVVGLLAFLTGFLLTRRRRILRRPAD